MTESTAHPSGDAERAEDHYRHRDEEDRWGEPVEARGPEILSVMVSARFSRAEADQLSEAAEAAGMSRSAFVRQAALSSAAGKVVNVARVRRSVDRRRSRTPTLRRQRSPRLKTVRMRIDNCDLPLWSNAGCVVPRASLPFV